MVSHAIYEAIDGIQTFGVIDVSDVKMMIYHYSNETLPVGFPAENASERLFSVAVLPSGSNSWSNLAFDGDLQYKLLNSLLSSVRLFSGRVSRAIIASPQYDALSHLFVEWSCFPALPVLVKAAYALPWPKN